MFRALRADQRGNAYALWEQRNSQFETIESLKLSVRPAGGGWSPPETIASSSAEQGFIGAWQSALAVAADGTATVAWCEQPELDYNTTAGTSITQAATRSPGGGWSQPVTLRRQDIYPCQGARIEVDLASDAAGNTLATWIEMQSRQLGSNSPPTTVWAAHRTAGQEWKPAVAVKQHSEDVFWPARVAFEPDGDAQLVGSTGGEGLWHAAVARDGSVSSPVDIPTKLAGFETGIYATTLNLAVDGGGSTIVTWSATRGPTSWSHPHDYVTLGVTRDPAGDWSAATPLFEGNAEPGGQNFPGRFVSLYNDAVGNIVAGWAGVSLREDERGPAYLAYRPVGGAWSNPAVVGDLVDGPPVVARQPSFSPALAATFSRTAVSSFEFAPGNYPRAKLRTRVPRRLSAATVLRDKGFTVGCRLIRGGYCGVRLLPDKATQRIIGKVWRSCLRRAANFLRARQNREAKIKFHFITDPGPTAPRCSPYGRRVLTARGADLLFKVVLTGDSLGSVSSTHTKTLTISR